MSRLNFDHHRRQIIQSLAASGLILPGLVSELLADERPDNGSRDATNPLRPRSSHFVPRAKRVIFMFMTGGVSHVDTFDHKPYLTEHHDQHHKGNQYYKGTGWKFRRYGESGMEISDLFPHIGSVADELCLIRSMQNINGDHFGATIGLHTGSATFNRPSIGSWVSYGLGTENRNLPSFVVISKGLPYAGGQVWGSDFLPVLHQGTRVRPGHEPIPHMHRRSRSAQQQRDELAVLDFLNRRHLQDRAADQRLRARMQSFETAAGMQLAAPDAFDVSQESEATHKLYGLDSGDTDSFAWQCLVARRLAERGVRFIELIDGDTNVDRNWDAHAQLTKYDRLARNVDRPIAGLINDLKSRGMFDDTLLVFATEFGRGPFVPSPGTDGRGHHSRVYSSWMAGAGINRGQTYGSSDELGQNVADGLVTVHDFQATILQQLGIDHERLTFRHAGRDYRLTDVHGRVVDEILSS